MELFWVRRKQNLNFPMPWLLQETLLLFLPLALSIGKHMQACQLLKTNIAEKRGTQWRGLGRVSGMMRNEYSTVLSLWLHISLSQMHLPGHGIICQLSSTFPSGFALYTVGTSIWQAAWESKAWESCLFSPHDARLCRSFSSMYFSCVLSLFFEEYHLSGPKELTHNWLFIKGNSRSQLNDKTEKSYHLPCTLPFRMTSRFELIFQTQLPLCFVPWH